MPKTIEKTVDRAGAAEAIEEIGSEAVAIIRKTVVTNTVFFANGTTLKTHQSSYEDIPVKED